MRDKVTHASRGFGFVTFADPSSVDKVMSSELELEGRKVDCKLAVPRQSIGTAPGMHRTRKLFVGGLAAQVTQDEFKQHFAQFGNVVNAVIMMDHTTSRSRGFGFVTFDSESTLDAVLARSHILGGKQIECKKALPKGKIIAEKSLLLQDVTAQEGSTGVSGSEKVGGYADFYGYPPYGFYGYPRGPGRLGAPFPLDYEYPAFDGYGGYGAVVGGSVGGSVGSGSGLVGMGGMGMGLGGMSGGYGYGPIRPGGGARAGGAYSAGGGGYGPTSGGSGSSESRKADRSFHPYSR